MIRFLALSLFIFTSSAFASAPVFVNLKQEFKSFVDQAQNKDFETQLQIWQSEVESALPQVYSELFSQNPDKTLEQNRREKAAQWFPFIFAHAEKILAQFDAFEKNGWPMAQRLASNYPNVDFSDVKVIAMPSLMSFNGQVRDRNGKIVALFGMDFLQLVEENPKLIEGVDLVNNTSVLVAHEFTHALFRKISDSKADDPSLGLWNALWSEGLAQMHSQMLVPGTDLTTVLMERNLAAQCKAPQVSGVWAAMFLQDAKDTSDAGLAAGNAKWFLMRGWQNLGVPRAGYCLGYHVVLHAMRNHSLTELINMKPVEAFALAKKALQDMASAQ